MSFLSEAAEIRQRYARRAARNTGDYDPVHPSVWMAEQERERMILRWISECAIAPVATRRLLEVGCGSGGNLLTLLRLGFRPQNLVGNDLLPERIRHAREILPAGVTILEGDALELDLEPGSFDVVFQSTVFTSILDPEFRQALARRMWSWVAPGGGVLWYDFTYDNPRNPDVRGVTRAEIARLFPEGRIRSWRLTLAPPINRAVTRVHPALYTVLNLLPFLRTHLLCWIRKEPNGTNQ